MPPRPTQRPQPRTNMQSRNTTSTNQNNNYQQNTARVRNIKTTTDDASQTGSNQSEENESVDPESTCYIGEMMEDWNTVNFVQWKESQTKINKINQTQMAEYWIETHSGKCKIHWFVDTGSPRSFVSQTTANRLTNKLGKKHRKQRHKSGRIQMLQQQQNQNKQHPQHRFIIRKHGRTKL